MIPFRDNIKNFNLQKCVIKVDFYDGKSYELKGICLVSNDNYQVHFYNTARIYPPMLPFLNFCFKLSKTGPITTFMDFYQLTNNYTVEYNERYQVQTFDISFDNYFYPDICLDVNDALQDINAIKNIISEYDNQN